MIRVFIAVDFSEAAKTEIGRLIDKFSLKRWLVRWEEKSKLHITLFFIGWIKEDKVEEIRNVIKKASKGLESFSIKVGKLGVFPDYIQPRVIWLGIKGDQPELIKLRKKVADKLISLGFKESQRKWIPHLTIGRVIKKARFKAKKELGRQLKKLETSEFQEITLIDRIVVYESKLSLSGSEYKKLFDILLT